MILKLRQRFFRLCVAAATLLTPVSLLAGPDGDTFEFGLAGWAYNQSLRDAGGTGWEWWGGIDRGLAQTTESFTFGTPGAYEFFGNTLTIDSRAVSTGPNTERWIFEVTAQDGGLIFDPDGGIYEPETNPTGYRAFHLNRLGIGEFPPWTAGDPLNDPSFVTFENIPDDYTGIGDWINESSGVSFFDENGIADYSIGPYDDGDWSRNLAVDGGDFVDWQRNYLSNATRYDADGNDFVDNDDLAIWAQNYGDTSAPHSLNDITLWAIEQPTGIYLDRSFANLSRRNVIFYDDGINSPNDSEITRIAMYVDVIVGGAATSVPEPNALLLGGLSAMVATAWRRIG